MRQTSSRWTILALLCLSSVVFLGKSYETTLQALDSAEYARLALEASRTPLHLPIAQGTLGPGHWEHGFNEQPATLLILNGFIMRALGPSAWSARLLPGLFSVGCVLLTYLIGTLLFTEAFGALAGFALALTPEFIGYGARFHLDTPFIFFILLSFVGFIQRRFWLTSIAAALGLWIKSPVSFLIYPAAALSLTMTRSFTAKERRWLLKSLVAALCVGAVVWIFTGLFGSWNLVTDYWQRQVFGTAVGGRGQSISAWVFAEILLKRYWPWLPFLAYSLFWILKNRAWKKNAGCTSSLWRTDHRRCHLVD